jgi:signal transduction histidine kinase
MEPKRRSTLIYGLLLATWVVVVVWQMDEHARVEEGGRNDLRSRSKAIASTLGAVIRGQQFRGAVFRNNLEPVLNELVGVRTNELTQPGEVISIALLNSAGGEITSAGRPIGEILEQKDLHQEGEHWGTRSMTSVFSIRGAFRNQEDTTNAQGPLILEQRTNFMRGGPRGFPRREFRPDQMGNSNAVNFASTNVADTNVFAAGQHEMPPPPPPDEGPRPGGPGFDPGNRGERGGPPREGEPRPRRPFWARDLDDKQYQDMIEKRELHGLALTLSTETLQARVSHDLWLRYVICFFAGISAIGVGLAWRNTTKTSDLQIRLVRASELNTHLKEMNLAAAGLAHETRNPLNIIRGMAQMLSKQNDTPPEIREKSRAIVDETDKVTAQLNEFINYSRPREVRRAPLALTSAVNEVARALSYDLEEKKIRLEIKGDPITIEADEQLLRQALFNLVLNATQAVSAGGQIQIVTQRNGADAAIEIRDDGPGVPPERRQEIFKPYFTTHQKGTGLGLAVVQQIVQAHGWEIECLPNEPKGAIFRITHLKVAA